MAIDGAIAITILICLAAAAGFVIGGLYTYAAILESVDGRKRKW